MSIIYEALKRIEPGLNLENKKKKKQLRKLTLSLLGILLGLGYLFFLYSAGIAFNIKKQEISSNPQTKSNFVNKPRTEQKINLKSESQYRLSGILYEKNKPIAVINEKTVLEGDKIGKAVVTLIKKDKVELLTDDKTLTLELD
jgi:amino acid transporter